MRRFELESEAGQISAELVRRGVAATSRVHVVVEVDDDTRLSLAEIAQTGGAFDWLEDEPDLYTESDLRPVR